MRTTVTLEDDVAAALARIEKQEGTSPKEVINTAVRELVARRARRSRAAARYVTPAVDLGACLVGSLDDVGDALAHAEGDDFR
jgi:metal-responsive CopG/Arc/MetJ family transcriptional regulator